MTQEDLALIYICGGVCGATALLIFFTKEVLVIAAFFFVCFLLLMGLSRLEECKERHRDDYDDHSDHELES